MKRCVMMKKVNKKLTLTAILATSTVLFAKCAGKGHMTVETDNRTETTSADSRETERSVEKTTDEDKSGGSSEESLIDFMSEDNMNVCVYGPPPEDK